MKKMFSLRPYLFLIMMALMSFPAKAQVISTAYTNGTNLTILFPGAAGPYSQYFIFTISNTNPYPVALREVHAFHLAEEQIGGVNISNNGAVYSLIKEPTPNGTGFPGANIVNWTFLDNSDPVYTAASGVTPVLTDLNDVIIPPFTVEQRFALVSTDTLVVRGTYTTPALGPVPYTFSAGGVTFRTSEPGPQGAGNRIWFAGYPATSAYAGPGSGAFLYGFEGAIKIERAGPIVNVTGSPACVGETVSLSATLPPGVPASATIHWTDPIGNGFTGPIWNLTNITPSMAGKYQVVYELSGDTSAPTVVDVVVKPTPPAPKLTSKTEYCINEQFQEVEADGENIVWYLDPTGGTGTTIPPYVNTTYPGTYTWYATQTVDGCESAERSSITIEVAPMPAPPVVSTPIGFCEKEPASPLTAIGTGLRWYDVPHGGIGAVIAPTPGTSVQDTQQYWVSQTIDGCESPRAKIDVVITFKPNGMIVPSLVPSALCQGDTMSFRYYGSGTPTTAYNWTIPTGGSPIGEIGNNGQGPLVIQFDTAGTYQVSLVAGNLGCFSDPYTHNVRVKPIPSARIASANDVCLNAVEMISLYEYTATVDTFHWDFDGGQLANYSTDQGPYGVFWTEPGEKVIHLRLDDEGCFFETSDTLTVHQIPDARFQAVGLTDGATVCLGDSVQFMPMTLEGTSSYQWSPSRFFGFYAQDPVSYGVVEYSGPVSLYVKDAYGCENEASMEIHTVPCCELYFPTAFTPNGDGINDQFGAITQSNAQLKSFRILNRWGQTVFQTNDILQKWDGTMNGEPQDIGTYFYLIEYRCENRDQHMEGEVTLIR